MPARRRGGALPGRGQGAAVVAPPPGATAPPGALAPPGAGWLPGAVGCAGAVCGAEGSAGGWDEGWADGSPVCPPPVVDAPVGVAEPVGTGAEVGAPPGTDVVGDAVEDGCDVAVASGPWLGRGAGVEEPVETTRPSEVPEVLLLETGWPITASATLMVPMATTKTPTTTAVRRAKGLRPPTGEGLVRDRVDCAVDAPVPGPRGREARPTPPSAGAARAAGCRPCAGSGRRPPNRPSRRRNRPRRR